MATTTLHHQGSSVNLHYYKPIIHHLDDYSPCLSKQRNNNGPSCLASKTIRYKRGFTVCTSVQPEHQQPLPAKPNFFDTWKSWSLGIFLSVVLPFSHHGKWGPLLKLKNEVETTLQTAEDVVETVEKAATVVEKMAEDALDDLPDSGRLKRVVAYIEKIAEFTAKKADAIDNVIDEVQELGEKVEAYMELVNKMNHNKDPTKEEADEEKAKELSKDEMKKKS